MLNVEKEFNSYIIYVAEIENCKIEIKAIINDLDINGVSYEERTGNTNKTSNPTQDKLFNRESSYCKYEYRMKQVQNKVDKMHNAVTILSESEKKVIELNYFNIPSLNVKQIQSKTGLSGVSIYRIKNRALERMQRYFSEEVSSAKVV